MAAFSLHVDTVNDSMAYVNCIKASHRPVYCKESYDRYTCEY